MRPVSYILPLLMVMGFVLFAVDFSAVDVSSALVGTALFSVASLLIVRAGKIFNRFASY